MEFATDKFLALASQKVAVLVDDGNFLAWKQHVLLIVKTHRLQMFLEGTVSIPLRMLVNEEGVSDENSLYVRYEQQDSALAAWLLSTISPTLYNQLVGSSGSSSKIKHLCDSLAGCGQCVTMEEQQSAILNGLPPEFDHVVSIITTSRVPFDLQGITTALLDAEARQQGHFTQTVFSANVTAVHKDVPVPSVPSYTGQPPPDMFRSTPSDGEGENSSFRDNTESWARSSHMGRKPIQAYIHHVGLLVPVQTVCIGDQGSYHSQYSTDGHGIQSHESPGIAVPSTVFDSAWYPDSGATAHMTNDSAKLSDARLYNGGGKVVIGGPEDSSDIAMRNMAQMFSSTGGIGDWVIHHGMLLVVF
ncbi:hypothetical protein PVK06_021393 [Gossypium arboreum]|uniref:Uncharacterized protein n=1 Tax=Gossypium arboreum TaxID=29729 RepID=A0ABR0PPW5_GOSAR|nr:hypothetical protein PVK06_021393 [Gossypium arboreum]